MILELCHNAVVRARATHRFARAIACVQRRTNMKFVCPVCGYVEEFDGEELPADFKCPQCGVSGDRFRAR